VGSERDESTPASRTPTKAELSEQSRIRRHQDATAIDAKALDRLGRRRRHGRCRRRRRSDKWEWRVVEWARLFCDEQTSGEIAISATWREPRT
jgi:hypothetical protein